MQKQNTLTRLKEKEREFRRDLIISAAREVFGKKSYDSVRMTEIAKAAGIPKASIYTYFKNQEELYIEIRIRDFQFFLLFLLLHITTFRYRSRVRIIAFSRCVPNSVQSNRGISFFL